MTRDAIYASLLRLYPKAFRREYEEQIRQTFREFSSDSPHAPAYFWSLVLRDLSRSVVREHVDAWTCGMGRLTLQWLCACSLGAMASGAAIWAFIVLVNLVFPPRIDTRGVVHVFGRNLPMGVYGALIGLVIGSAQTFALRRHVKRGSTWIIGTALAGAAGFPLSLALANWIGGRLLPLGYVAGVTLLGVLLGIVQSLVLKGTARSAASWVVWSAFAVPAGILTGAACEFLLRADPRTWQGLVLAFAVYPAVIGVTIGALTVRPLMTLLRDHRQSPHTQPT